MVYLYLNIWEKVYLTPALASKGYENNFQEPVL